MQLQEGNDQEFEEENRFEMNEINLVLGDALFAGLPGMDSTLPVMMVEDYYLCTRVKHHKLKIVLFLSAMRHFAKALEVQGRTVHYYPLSERNQTIFDLLHSVIKEKRIEKINLFQPNDAYFVKELKAKLEGVKVELNLLPSPSFMTSPDDWQSYCKVHKRRLMADFYIWQRTRLGILMENGKPTGGQWSFDAENRKPLPKGFQQPVVSFTKPDSITTEVMEMVDREFSDHPGVSLSFEYPVTHDGARLWLEEFLEFRFEGFGPYEDALSKDHRIILHSLLTPFLNSGLLTPKQVVDATLLRSENKQVPLASLEGFIRQLIGWREFMKGMDETYEEADTPNFLDNQRQLKNCWWEGTTGLSPLDKVIKRALEHGYCHHIERLMVLGSVMLMCDVHPGAAYDWFMTMFIDSADWVMRPNIFGMSQFADGGRFTTKPYVSGSAYIRKMSDFAPGPWCDIWDGLYWRFVSKHREKFARNPRMTMMLASLTKLDPVRKERILKLAEDFIESVTLPGKEPLNV